MIRLVFLLCLTLVVAAPLRAGQIEARVSLSEQRMRVFLDGQAVHSWPVSTARAGKFTPLGEFTVQSMKRMHRSSLYNNAPMPWSIFFSGNFAIHGTDQVSRLGTPASAGCVRLHPDDAQTLYQMVRDHGRTNTLINILR